MKPKPGQKWQYKNPWNPNDNVWEILEILNEHAVIRNIQNGVTDDRYPIHLFAESLWECVGPPEMCPRCEKYEIDANDYLCSKCRWGV